MANDEQELEEHWNYSGNECSWWKGSHWLYQPTHTSSYDNFQSLHLSSRDKPTLEESFILNLFVIVNDWLLATKRYFQRAAADLFDQVVQWFIERSRWFKFNCGPRHPQVRKATKKSKLGDASITPFSGAPTRLLTLKWDAFEFNNSDSCTECSSLTEKYRGVNCQLGSVLTRMTIVEALLSVKLLAIPTPNKCLQRLTRDFPKIYVYIGTTDPIAEKVS